MGDPVLRKERREGTPGSPYDYRNQSGPPSGYGFPSVPPPGQQPQQQQYGQQPQEPQSYFQGFAPPELPNDGALATQMGGLGLGEVSSHGRKKKKDRHAHHVLDAPTSGGTFNNNLQNAPPASTPYLNDGAQFGNQQITPQMSQFPAPVNAPFNPANAATSAEHAARTGPPEGGLGANVQTSPQGRVDPEQVPSVPRSRDALSQYYLKNVYPTMQQHVPPPAAVSFVAYDQSNSSPKFTRLTMNSIPTTSEALSSTGLPLGLLLQPLAPLQAGELEIPLLDFGDVGPPRCHRCRAYINPFMIFSNGGNKFACNMCHYANDVPPEYFSALTPAGARVDRDQRPELVRGTVEFTVPREYWSKEPVGLRWLFVIDVSQEAVNKGILEAFCQGVLHALYSDEDQVDENGDVKRTIPKPSRIGFVTYDKEIHFYNMNVSINHDNLSFKALTLFSLHLSKLR
jgi:protein transport protein SEC24